MKPPEVDPVQSSDDGSSADDFAGMPFRSWPQVYGFVLAVLVLLVSFFWLVGELFS